MTLVVDVCPPLAHEHIHLHIHVHVYLNIHDHICRETVHKVLEVNKDFTSNWARGLVILRGRGM